MNLNKPLCFFDIESTGTDVANDRIISLVVNKQFPNDANEIFGILCNPGIPIKPEAGAVNGFDDETVSVFQPFKSHAEAVHNFVKGCDLAGFNCLNFDVPMLWEELFRSGITWDLTGVQIIDVGNIFKKKEPHTLTAAVKFYCGREMIDAHDAMADVQATADVLNGQLERYMDLDLMDIPQLAEFSRMEKRLDLAGKIVENEKGEAVFGFGKSKGVRIADDPGFARWMLDKDFTQNTKQVVKQILKIK